MFGFFKKPIREPLELQLKDLGILTTCIGQECKEGVDCDTVPGGHGAFGSVTNPIPVNGPIGEIKYLGKLRARTGFAFFFHRLGSTSGPTSNNSIDIYEVVSLDATHWATLHFDLYHPRRSNLAPEGFQLVPFYKQLGQDIACGYGVNFCVNNFPHEIPEALVTLYGEHPGATLARHARGHLGNSDFRRPAQFETALRPMFSGLLAV